jgi:hypothetical protein
MAQPAPSTTLRRVAADETELDVDLLAAALRADAADHEQFAEALATKLEMLLPARTRVVRRRAGLMGSKRARSVTLRLDAVELELRADQAGIEPLVASVSGGIVLKRERVELDEWVRRLSAALADEAARSERTRRTLEQWLT